MSLLCGVGVTALGVPSVPVPMPWLCVTQYTLAGAHEQEAAHLVCLGSREEGLGPDTPFRAHPVT